MEKIYKISHAEKKGTPYASTIISDNSLYLDSCPECKRSIFNRENKDLSLVIEGKIKLPDYLLCGHFPLFLVSQKVIEKWEENNMTGYEAFPIKKLLDKNGNDLATDVQYFNVIITGRVELDFEKMNVFIKYQCSMCGGIGGGIEYNKKVWEFGEKIIKQGTHDGSDLFVAKYFESTPICTSKLLEIVYKEKLTNFEFSHHESDVTFPKLPPAINLKTELGFE